MAMAQPFTPFISFTLTKTLTFALAMTLALELHLEPRDVRFVQGFGYLNVKRLERKKPREDVRVVEADCLQNVLVDGRARADRDLIFRRNVDRVVTVPTHESSAHTCAR